MREQDSHESGKKRKKRREKLSVFGMIIEYIKKVNCK